MAEQSCEVFHDQLPPEEKITQNARAAISELGSIVGKPLFQGKSGKTFQFEYVDAVRSRNHDTLLNMLQTILTAIERLEADLEKRSWAANKMPDGPEKIEEMEKIWLQRRELVLSKMNNLLLEFQIMKTPVVADGIAEPHRIAVKSDTVQVWLHELWHRLGLPHIDDEGNIMFPTNTEVIRKFSPQQIEDIKKVAASCSISN